MRLKVCLHRELLNSVSCETYCVKEFHCKMAACFMDREVYSLGLNNDTLKWTQMSVSCLETKIKLLLYV